MVSIGMIHGRFQPFHIGHFDYLRSALKQCSRLIVGITNPEPRATREAKSDDHRHRPEHNPFSFYLRARMIEETLQRCPECDNWAAHLTIVPFPIHTPEVWQFYVPGRNVVQFLRLLDPWDHEKRDAFIKFGYHVQTIPGDRMMSGIAIRKDLASGGSSWRDCVPAGTLWVLEQWLSAYPV